MANTDNSSLERYSIITEKNPREITLLRGNGCKWLKCRFCNYHLDRCPDEEQNFILNKEVLDKVSGIYTKLEVINSGSFVDLDAKTMNYIVTKCSEKNISEIHFECHYMHKDKVADLRKLFAGNGIDVKIKIGVETFDSLFREAYLVKGIDTDSPAEIAKYFDEVCLLQGIPGQTSESMINDIETGLKYFERVCVNIMVDNGMPIRPDPRVIKNFIENVYPLYINNNRVDILLNNTDFGVG
ncbi:MAG: radical SAM protein [Lachnospiraceae bacterium]|nr:radical SAM protein [Clostridiales bacterium]MDD6293380.1 radical SAM protein [Eubacteriales bacterium]MDY2606327.1 radical SAM protein [Lachnospiraceae bacterium]